MYVAKNQISSRQRWLPSQFIESLVREGKDFEVHIEFNSYPYQDQVWYYEVKIPSEPQKEE